MQTLKFLIKWTSWKRMQEEGKDKKINSEFKKFQISRIQKKKKNQIFPSTLYILFYRHFVTIEWDEREGGREREKKRERGTKEREQREKTRMDNPWQVTRDVLHDPVIRDERKRTEQEKESIYKRWLFIETSCAGSLSKAESLSGASSSFPHFHARFISPYILQTFVYS